MVITKVSSLSFKAVLTRTCAVKQQSLWLIRVQMVMPFGGLAVGEPTEVMYEMIEVVNEILPKDKPRYLMGVGTPQNILEAIERGVDMFDCVMPTRNGRNAMLFTYNGTMNMKNKKWENDFSPIDQMAVTLMLSQVKPISIIFSRQENCSQCRLPASTTLRSISVS